MSLFNEIDTIYPRFASLLRERYDDSTHNDSIVKILRVKKKNRPWFFEISAIMMNLKEEEEENAKNALTVSIFLDDACTLASILLLVFSHSRRRRLLCQTIPCGGPFKEFTKIDVSIQPNHTLYHLFQSRILQGCR